MDAIVTYVVNVVSLGGTYALLALGLAGMVGESASCLCL